MGGATYRSAAGAAGPFLANTDVFRRVICAGLDPVGAASGKPDRPSPARRLGSLRLRHPLHRRSRDLVARQGSGQRCADRLRRRWWAWQDRDRLYQRYPTAFKLVAMVVSWVVVMALVLLVYALYGQI